MQHLQVVGKKEFLCIVLVAFVVMHYSGCKWGKVGESVESCSAIMSIAVLSLLRLFSFIY